MTAVGSLPLIGVGDLFDGRYELLEPAGTGTTSEVWKAHDRRRDQIVALKILQGVTEDSAWHEASRLTALESPHILRVNNASLAIDVPYIDTALAERGTAGNAAGRWGMAPSQAVHLTRGMLRGLELCHQRQLLHRDIKPANVFLTATGDAQLGDFGLSAFMDAAGEAAGGAGDPDVRAPEVLKGARYTRQADVYAAGLTLYALLTGALPFSIAAAGDFKTHRTLVLAGMPDIRDVAPNVSLSLAKIVRAATTSKPVDRYPSAAVFDSALGRLPSVSASANRVEPHVGHARCWSAIRTRDSHKFAVCVSSGPAGRWSLECSHAGSGNRLTDHCHDGLNARQLAVRARRAFDHLGSL